MSCVIVTGCDTSLINSIAKVFPTFYDLLCMQHITKNVTSKTKCVLRNKQSKDEDGKMIKHNQILKPMMRNHSRNW